MDDRALLSFKDTDDTELIPCSGGKAVIDQTFFKARWDLGPKSIYISERTTFDSEVVNFLVRTPSAFQTPQSTRDSSQLQSTIDEAGSTTAPALSWPGISNDPTIISSFQALRQVRWKSELSRLELTVFAHQLVVQLPDRYNGNVVFELPPKRADEVHKKGALLEGISVNDTHQPDKVARTQQTIRFSKGRVLFGAELDHDRTPVTTERCKPANPAASRPADDDAEEELISKSSQRPADPAGSRQDKDEVEEEILNSYERPATAAANTDKEGVPTSNVTSQTIPATPASTDNHDNTAPVGNTPNAATSPPPGPEEIPILADNPADTFVAEAQRHTVNPVQSTPARNTRSTTSVHASRPTSVADRVTPRTTRRRTVNRETAPENSQHASRTHRTVQQQPLVVSISSDSDIEVLRIRPPTRSVPFIPHQPLPPGPTQYGLPIIEVHVDVRQWHICRTATKGAGPACFAATPGRAAPRAMCKTKLRVSGFQRLGVGVVAPTFIGKTAYMNIEQDYRFWFCPNGRCHRGPGAPQCRT
ncbi:hypothetical protein R1sor_012932 [Riccia sorocarpa]|uniref:Uncharacterized protein n=1 Tax=Riccia sorocarpa TaxID=122646 RepID=A0ABD3I5S7_9MARC